MNNTKLVTIINSTKIKLPEHGFYCGYLDRQQNLWFGSRGNGVFKFDGKKFTQFSIEDGLCSNDISCIMEDTFGNM